ncbi:hypothetical protein LTR10_007124 [Elasticomyces elasticus]|nr:hypothetical protein LTR10_007124 [Elasticomyces elasticus]
MVYRGKPSAGCEACRKAKKRCTLETPACSRCVKLKKDCSGYRDMSQLQIQDESESVIRKAIRQKARPVSVSKSATYLTPSGRYTPGCILTPASLNSDSLTDSDATFDNMMIQDWSETETSVLDMDDVEQSLALVSTYNRRPIPFSMRPVAADLATNHFFTQFTANGHWEFLRAFDRKQLMDPCLTLAIRACGMAALDNVEHINHGRDYARTMYIEALGLLNSALQDPERSKTDESLIAVAMLSYYENLVCDSRESIQSWKAHISGATQLLKIRGPAQFKTSIGRTLFRETRAQIMIHCIWDDLEPPSFLWDWQEELKEQSPEYHFAKPADDLIEICFDFARIRARIEMRTIDDAEALSQVNEIDRRMVQWSIDTLASAGEFWRYSVVEVEETPHIWNGVVHVYAGHPAPSVWNTHRSIRIMVTRSQEWLCRRLKFFTAEEREEQLAYFRKVRRQMTDDICAGTPAALGQAPSPCSSPAILISAYGAVWPLFFAGTCALERLGTTKWDAFKSPPPDAAPRSSAAAAQAAWLVGRLQFISDVVGLRWATGIAAALQGDFTLHTDLLPDDLNETWGLEIGHKVDGTPRPAWTARQAHAKGLPPLVMSSAKGDEETWIQLVRPR